MTETNRLSYYEANPDAFERIYSPAPPCRPPVWWPRNRHYAKDRVWRRNPP